MRVTLRLRSFFFAAAVCMAATLLSWVSRAPSSCFHLAIVICSLYGGRGAGLLSIGLAALSFDYFFLSSHFRLSPELSTYPRFAAFIATALCINLAIAAKQRVERARREAIEDRQAARRHYRKSNRDLREQPKLRPWAKLRPLSLMRSTSRSPQSSPTRICVSSRSPRIPPT